MTSVALVLVPCWGLTHAQVGKLQVIAQAFQENRKELTQYHWKSRTEVSLDGEVQQIDLVDVCYDGQGRLRKMPVESEDRPGAGSARRRAGKKQRRKVAEMAANLEDLIQSYTELDPQRMQAALSMAHVWEGEGEQAGTARVQARGVVRQGDAWNMWVDSVTRLPLRFEILTSLEGEPVRLMTEFSRLENGPTYAARTVVETEIKEKKMVLHMENFDLERRGE
jgi:hypothetical protein